VSARAARRAVLVVNPTSANGATGRLADGLVGEFARWGIEARLARTEAAGHATALAREAVQAGEPLVVAVGGDGTVNEVVNGFADEHGAMLGAPTALGVIERGTGCDFIRTHQIPKKLPDALRVIAEGVTRRVDVGRVTCRAEGGGELVRLFANHASCGLTGDVATRANASSKRLGGTAAFLWATVSAFRAWRNVPFRIVLDGVERGLVANNVICANGRQLGGGIRVAPRAEPDDGFFDVVIIGDVGKLALARNVHRMYLGTLEKDPRVEIVRAADVIVQPEQPLPVEVDGELPGVTPVRFEMLHKALDLVVPG
jgi:YegS/Rv2252/BmrU family lipid kinase